MRRLLLSPVTDYRLMGVAGFVGAIPLVVLAIAYGAAGQASFMVPWMTISFGLFTYLVIWRRRVPAGVAVRTPAPAEAREDLRATVRRVIVVASLQLVALALLGFAFLTVSAIGTVWFQTGAGVMAGQGLAYLLTARWLRAWERAHREQLLAPATPLRLPWRRVPGAVGPGASFVFYRTP